jgi:hypothetical protein
MEELAVHRHDVAHHRVLIVHEQNALHPISIGAFLRLVHTRSNLIYASVHVMKLDSWWGGLCRPFGWGTC